VEDCTRIHSLGRITSGGRFHVTLGCHFSRYRAHCRIARVYWDRNRGRGDCEILVLSVLDCLHRAFYRRLHAGEEDVENAGRYGRKLVTAKRGGLRVENAGQDLQRPKDQTVPKIRRLQHRRARYRFRTGP